MIQRDHPAWIKLREAAVRWTVESMKHVCDSGAGSNLSIPRDSKFWAIDRALLRAALDVAHAVQKEAAK